MLECHEVPRLRRETTLQPVLKPSTKRGFAASPIDTTMAPKKPATRDDACWSIKKSISCETLSNFTFRSFKIDVFLQVFLWTYTSKSTFRARLPSICITCHKMPRMPRNLQLVTTSRSPDNAIRQKYATQHVESAAPAMQNDTGGLQSAAPAMNNATHLLKTLQKYCACHTKPFLTRRETWWNVTKCHACDAK